MDHSYIHIPDAPSTREGFEPMQPVVICFRDISNDWLYNQRSYYTKQNKKKNDKTKKHVKEYITNYLGFIN